MITDIFTIYITMRMRQFTYIENQKSNKINRTKKKLSKLVSSYVNKCLINVLYYPVIRVIFMYFNCLFM